MGANYGGSTTSILVNIPGEASSVVTCLDGYQMAKKGRARPCFWHCCIWIIHCRHSFCFRPCLFYPCPRKCALKFGPTEYASLIIFSLTTLAFLARDLYVKHL